MALKSTDWLHGEQENSVGITGLDSTVAIAVAKTNLADGVDGTAGIAGAILYDDDGIWISNGISTTAVSNWKQIEYTS